MGKQISGESKKLAFNDIGKQAITNWKAGAVQIGKDRCNKLGKQTNGEFWAKDRQNMVGFFVGKERMRIKTMKNVEIGTTVGYGKRRGSLARHLQLY